MKVVVFGGSGFLGSHVADVLSEKGFNVSIFDSRTSKHIQGTQKMKIGDITDSNAVRKVVKGAKYVYHFAGIADLSEAQSNPVETVKNNILGTTYILDACRKEGVDRFLFASSIYVYSELGSFYRSSKQACELLIENYNEIFGLPYTILRYGSLYGRRANEFNFINNAITQALLEGKITRKGDGSEMRDYINVVDAARASVEVLDKEFEDSYVMISGTQSMRIRDLLNMIREMLNDEVEVEYVEGQYEGHYEITPYSFKPRVARKYILPYYHDLGQGILDCIYDTYKRFSRNSESPKIKVDVPNGVDYQDDLGA